MASNPVVFHSDNIRDTKAREKREVFVKVEEKKTLKQSAAEFQQKFAAAKAHAAESRAKIENPGADEHGVIRSAKRINIPWRKVVKFAIPVVILAGIGLAIYLNWGAIHHEFFEVSERRAKEFIESSPQRYIEMYDKLIDEAKTEDEKVELLFNRIATLDGAYGNQYAEQILSDTYKAYEILPCYETALQIIETENKYGSPEKASEWSAKLDSSEKEGLILGNG